MSKRRETRFNRALRECENKHLDFERNLEDVFPHVFSEKHTESMNHLFYGEELPSDPVTKKIIEQYTTQKKSPPKRFFYYAKASILLIISLVIACYLILALYTFSSSKFRPPISNQADTREETKNLPLSLE